jgi:hypothetical protein
MGIRGPGSFGAPALFLASIHQIAENRYSRKVGFRHTGFSETQLWMVHGRLLHPRATSYTLGPIQSSTGDEAHLITASTVMLMASTWGLPTGYWVGAFLRSRAS